MIGTENGGRSTRVDLRLNRDYTLPSMNHRTDHTALIFNLRFLWTVHSALN
jgi:hypothetical protein